MYKKPHERVRDFFINMGKHHRLLLPIAVVGLAVTMLITNIVTYLRRGTKRIACTVFILCFFLIGNSFAYPYLSFNNGFVSEEESSDELIAAEDSSLTLLEDEEKSESGTYDNVTPSEAEGIEAMQDFYSLEDILEEMDSDEYGTSDIANEADGEGKFNESDWRLTLINKQHPIPEDYAFSLGNISSSMQCDERIIADLVLLMQAAKSDGANLKVASPYRSDDRQEYLFNKKINAYMKSGYSYMEAYKLSSQAVTVPGSSEHQVGLAIDFNTDTHIYLDEAFGETNEGIWLREHCAEYGFILRYPKDKEYITSIEYEPWHFRYVGKEAAKIIMDEGICLEEFWEKYIN